MKRHNGAFKVAQLRAGQTRHKRALRDRDSAAQPEPSQPAMPPTLAARPKVDFGDVLMHHAAMRAKGIGLCSFLIALAAFQRGLKVTFHYERASSDPRFAHARVQGHRGELFSISDGKRTHMFSRSMGDRTSAAASAVADDKHLTKRALARAGVRTPAGVSVEAGQRTLIEEFLARHPSKRFVVKPVAGSLARAVRADLPAAEVLRVMSEMAGSRLVLEEHVAGTEYRVAVVASRCVAVFRRDMLAVVGDGLKPIERLLDSDNARRMDNPHTKPVECNADLVEYLARQGLSLTSVPACGQRVQLLNTAYGATLVDRTGSVPREAEEAAVRAVQALGLPNGGVDLILSEQGEVFVLEVNQRAHIGGHSFPLQGAGQGNAVAEAIVDFYFPQSAQQPTHPGLVFDFKAVQTALESAQFAEVSLPLVRPDWRVIRLRETGVTAQAMTQLFQTAAKAAGAHVIAAPCAAGMEIGLAVAPEHAKNLLGLLPSQFHGRLAGLGRNLSA